MDPFKRDLYAEFESNCFKLLGVPSSRVREVFADRKTDINAKFEAAWDFGGAPFGRFSKTKDLIPLLVIRTAKPDTSVSRTHACPFSAGH